MKHSFILGVCLSSLLFLSGCKSDKNKESPYPDETPTLQEAAHNSRNSVDWAGTYEGELPCADCEGIKTLITINQDHTYVLKEVYEGKDEKPVESKGTFEWDDKGQKIKLSDSSRHGYFVGENTLSHLDENDERITGDLQDLYVLRKVQDRLEEVKWHLATYKGKEVVYKEAMSEHAYLQFEKDFTITGYTGCNNLQGAYHIEEAHKIEFSKLINTLKACPEMETEDKMLNILNKAAQYGFEEHALILYDENHQPLGSFKKAN